MKTALPTLKRLPNRPPLGLSKRRSRVPSGHTLDPEVQPVLERILHQVENGLDVDRLLPSREKRRRELIRKIERPLEENGYRTFVANAVNRLRTAKAPNRRAAERVLVDSIGLWHDECLDLAPERMDELYELILSGFCNPPEL